MDEPYMSPARLQLAAARRHHILDPVRIGPVGQRDDVAAGRGKDVDGGPVYPARFAAAMRDYAKSGHMRGYQPSDAIGGDAVEAPQPSGCRHASCSWCRAWLCGCRSPSRRPPATRRMPYERYYAMRSIH